VYAENLELEQAIFDAAERVEPWLVYADWLQAAGDPRGELIAAEVSLSHASAELHAHALTLRASLGWHLDGCTVDVAWHFGFVDTARIRAHELPDGVYQPIDLAPLWKQLTPRCGRFLRTLSVEMSEALNPLHDLPSLWTLAPRLESLTLRGYRLELGHIRAPRLRQLDVTDMGFDWPQLESFSSAYWPSLERLTLQGSANDFLCTQLLSGQGLDQLAHLHLLEQPLDDDMLAAPILSRLQTLTVSHVALTDWQQLRQFPRHTRLRVKRLEGLDAEQRLLIDQLSSRPSR